MTEALLTALDCFCIQTSLLGSKTFDRYLSMTGDDPLGLPAHRSKPIDSTPSASVGSQSIKISCCLLRQPHAPKLLSLIFQFVFYQATSRFLWPVYFHIAEPLLALSSISRCRCHGPNTKPSLALLVPGGTTLDECHWNGA